MELEVKCRPGPYGDAEPAEFTLGGQTISVTEVIDRWVGNDHRYFKARAGNDGVYILRFTPSEKYWELSLFRAKDAADFPLPQKSYLIQ